MNLNDKKQIVEDLSKQFEQSAVLIVTDYKGLDVTTMNSLRRQLREAGTEYRVVKNTLLIRASENNDINLIKDVFKGPNAIAFSYDDPVAPAKVLTQFAKENEKLEIKAGVMNGKVLNLEAIKSLSSLPSREELLAQVLATMVAVPTSLVRALNDIPQRMVNVLNAVKDQKSSAEA